MSISSAPSDNATFASETLAFVDMAPKGKPMTLHIFTSEFLKCSLANDT